MSIEKLTELDKHFCKYIARKSGGDEVKAFTLLVDAIGHGNGEYIINLCAALESKNDMTKAVRKILAMEVV